jgi:signal transduction histidine kinase
MAHRATRGGSFRAESPVREDEREMLRLRVLLQLIAHDLRSPLLGASVFLEELALAMAVGAPPEERAELLGGVRESLERLHGMAGRVRAAAQQSPLGRPAPEPLSAAAIAALLGAVGQTVQATEETLAPCIADPRMLEVALGEVLAHVAHEAAGHPLAVRVVSGAPPGQVCYGVFSADAVTTGVGAAPNDRSLYGSTGLAIAQQLLVAQGGGLWVEGGVYRILLPAGEGGPV